MESTTQKRYWREEVVEKPLKKGQKQKYLNTKTIGYGKYVQKNESLGSELQKKNKINACTGGQRVVRVEG